MAIVIDNRLIQGIIDPTQGFTMKISIEYSPDGQAISDFEVEDWANDIVKESMTPLSNFTGERVIGRRVSTALAIHQIRAFIKQGKLNHSEVIFVHNGLELKPDKDGRLENWPNGFCDNQENLLYILL